MKNLIKLIDKKDKKIVEVDPWDFWNYSDDFLRKHDIKFISVDAKVELFFVVARPKDVVKILFNGKNKEAFEWVYLRLSFGAKISGEYTRENVESSKMDFIGKIWDDKSIKKKIIEYIDNLIEKIKKDIQEK